MKKTLMMVLCVALCASCAAKRPVQQPVQQTVVEDDDAAAEIKRLEQELKLQQLKNQLKKEQLQADKEMAALEAEGLEVSIPCIESSFDDEDYFRELGIGVVSSGNMGAARMDAATNAKNLIKLRLGEFVQGINSFYYNTYTGSKPSNDVQSKTEQKLNGVVEKMLNDADKECEKRYTNAKGIDEWYYVVRIPKSDLKKKMLDVLSQEEKSNIDFNEYKMQEFMDKRMNEMLEAKKNAGY